MMPIDWGFETAKDIIEVGVWMVGFAAIYYAIRTFRVSSNQFQFSVMISCIERFQQLVPTLDSSHPDTIKKYVDLCNEELFYFKNKYVPKEVVKEWLDGMIYYLPHIDAAGNNLNGESLVKIEDLNNYPRLKHVFLVNRKYDLSRPQERQELIKSVNKQIAKYSWDLTNTASSETKSGYSAASAKSGLDTPGGSEPPGG